MSSSSSIEWTDATWNPVTGCTKVSPGCANCYIERTPAFRINGRRFERDHIPLRLHADRLEQPLHWRKPRRVFVNSLSDLFHPDVPLWFIDEVFATMALAPNHVFQILTKRPAALREYMSRPGKHADIAVTVFKRFTTMRESERHSRSVPWPLPNVWLGVSVENQRFADERIPLLLQTPAAVRFISAEPLLGPVDLTRIVDRTLPRHSIRNAILKRPCSSLTCLDWVIVGGESGRARPFDVAWARSIVAQCRAAGIPVLVKQFGRDVRDRNDAGFEGDTARSWPMDTDVQDYPNGFRDDYQGAPVRVRLVNKKGGDPTEWPEDLRVREFPEVHA